MHSEASYLATVNEAHRKAHGQFFTHPQVAEFMVSWALESDNRNVHDPAFGLGAFFRAAPEEARSYFTGSEIDPEILDYWRTFAPDNRADVTQEDYLTSWGRKYGNIVCNPPYMRFQKFINRSLVFEMFEYELGTRLSGYTNTASAFLLKSLSELQPDGRLAYIMPLEFFNTGYGEIVKRQLVAESHLAAVISFDCEKDVFPDVITSAGIILYDTSRKYSHVRFYTVKSIEELSSVLDTRPVAEIACGNLNPKDKWLSYLDDSPVVPNTEMTTPLEYYGRFIRGIATGANEFFAIRPSQANDLGLTASELSPCISKSAQIANPFFDDDSFAELVKQDDPVLLFDVKDHPSQEARAYIRFGESKEYHRRFLTKNRTPWYKTETRSPAPLLAGVFSRGRYKVIRNDSRAMNLTCFHGFQPNLNGFQYVDRLFLYLCSTVGQEIVSLSSRRYGDGLGKFEPNDLNTALVPAPQVFDQISTHSVVNALDDLKRTGRSPDYVESWFESLKLPPDDLVGRTETVLRGPN